MPRSPRRLPRRARSAFGASGTRSARNASGKTTSTPSFSGSGIAAADTAPTSVARFHVRNRLSSIPRSVCERACSPGDGDAEGLVGEEEARDRHLGRCQRDLPGERQPVQHVTHVQQERGEDDREATGRGGEQARGADLGATGEDEERERLSLDDRETGTPGGHRVGKPEGDHAEPERGHRPEAGPESFAPSVRHGRSLSDPSGESFRQPSPQTKTPPAAAPGGVFLSGLIRSGCRGEARDSAAQSRCSPPDTCPRSVRPTAGLGDDLLLVIQTVRDMSQ